MCIRDSIRPQLAWLLIIVLGLFGLTFFLSDTSGMQRIDTSASIKLIQEDKVDTAKLLNNERLELVLKDGVTYSDGSRVKDATKVYLSLIHISEPTRPY